MRPVAAHHASPPTRTSYLATATDHPRVCPAGSGIHLRVTICSALILGKDQIRRFAPVQYHCCFHPLQLVLLRSSLSHDSWLDRYHCIARGRKERRSFLYGTTNRVDPYDYILLSSGAIGWRWRRRRRRAKDRSGRSKWGLQCCIRPVHVAADRRHRQRCGTCGGSECS